MNGQSANINAGQPLLKIEHLKKYYEIPSKKLFDKSVRYLKAADDVSFEINRGETFALVSLAAARRPLAKPFSVFTSQPAERRILTGRMSLQWIRRPS